jgi:hypothetical protein
MACVPALVPIRTHGADRLVVVPRVVHEPVPRGEPAGGNRTKTVNDFEQAWIADGDCGYPRHLLASRRRRRGGATARERHRRPLRGRRRAVVEIGLPRRIGGTLFRRAAAVVRGLPAARRPPQAAIAGRGAPPR